MSLGKNEQSALLGDVSVGQEVSWEQQKQEKVIIIELWISCCNIGSILSAVSTMMVVEAAISKIINGNLHIPSNSLIPNHRDSRSGYFTQLQTRTDSYKFSFFPSTIKLWNSLPPSVINSPNLNQFCNNINTCAL